MGDYTFQALCVCASARVCAYVPLIYVICFLPLCTNVWKWFIALKVLGSSDIGALSASLCECQFWIYVQVSPSKLSQSEACLDSPRSSVVRVTPAKKTSLTSLPSREQPQADDETYSTDSNSTADEDLRRKKRKLFPTFARKHKSKTSWWQQQPQMRKNKASNREKMYFWDTQFHFWQRLLCFSFFPFV
jgi:hypothetical protein